MVRLSTGVDISAKFIVNAAGAYAHDLTPGLDVKKRKGHWQSRSLPRVRATPIGRARLLKGVHSTSADSVAFNVQPRRTGQVLIGFSRQYGCGAQRSR